MYEMLVGYPPFYSDDSMTTCRKIISWRSYLKFPEELNLSLQAKHLMSRLLCDVEHRLGTRGADEIKNHPWFKGVQWDTLYDMEAAYKPEVTSELDTQNFDKFEEMDLNQNQSAKSGPWRKMLPSKDANFVGYTYKSSDVFKSMQSTVADLRKKSSPKRRSIVSIFEENAPIDSSQDGAGMPAAHGDQVKVGSRLSVSSQQSHAPPS